MDRLRDKNLYYVGGVVRDELLGVQSFDTDFCYEGDAIEFANKNFKQNIIKTNPDFGTVRLCIDDKEIDIASTREESYPKPGHLPVVNNIGCSLSDDLMRRDFTINAMAKNTLTGEIYDPLNGLADLKSKTLKILHKNSFIDDPTRIVRALKFSVRFGFELESVTKRLQEEYLADINYDMSCHRLKKELTETFNLNSAEAFDKFVKTGIYRLLGDNQSDVKISGAQIRDAIGENFANPWIIYMSFFNLSNLPLTRAEKRILEWAERLKIEKATNNTPRESIVINNILRNSDKC